MKTKQIINVQITSEGWVLQCKTADNANIQVEYAHKINVYTDVSDLIDAIHMIVFNFLNLDLSIQLLYSDCSYSD